MNKTRASFFLFFIFIACSHLHADNATGAVVAAANSSYWHRLLHMTRGLFGGHTSDVDTPEFFLSPRGRADALAELKADLAAFVEPDPADANESARCRFPERFAWLAEQGLLPPNAARGACPRYEAWRSKLNPKSVSIVFASYYFNNPASMYGHTFLTLNRAQSSEPTHTLDYTVNYAAVTNSRSGLAFAVKGLAGGYQGRFSTDPYYVKIQQYTNLESRDLWEYELNLSTKDIDRLMNHLWELGSAGMAYFFLNRNCSYQLLPLLEAADPDLNLSQPFQFRAIPIDTLRAVIQVPGLVKARTFRPAHRTKMLDLRAQLSPDERNLAYNLALRSWPAAAANLDQAPAARQPMVLDAAYDLWRFRSGFRRPLPDAANAREQLLLTARNRLPAAENKAVSESARPSAPETAHPTGRISLDVGTDHKARFMLLDARPALHDLVNSSEGYPLGSELDMFHLRVRANSAGANASLDQFTLIEIKSLPAYDLWTRPHTWRLRTGFQVAKDLNKRPGSAGVYNLDGGSGITFALNRKESARWYSLLEMGAQTGPVFSSGFRVGVGARTGVAWTVHPVWRVNADAAIRRYGWGDSSTVNSLGFEQAITLSASWEWRSRIERANHARELSTGLDWYF
jgi:hypothetical protein